MARLSDIIEDFIKDMLDGNAESFLEIQRNELANHFSCAPSQINYVLTTRFTKDRGYYIESRRGGGGCIKITRLEITDDAPSIQNIVNNIGDSITCDSSLKLIDGMYETELIDDKIYLLMKVVVNDRTLAEGMASRNKLRADLLKAMIMVLFSY